MKRNLYGLVLLIMAFGMLLSFVACQEVLSSEAELLEKAREEMPIADAETAEIKYIGECTKGDKALLWFMSGNEFQAHHYLPMGCTVSDGGYVFKKAYKPLDRGEDISVIEWNGGYAFCVNNARCKAIKIADNSGEKVIEVAEYPFIYYNRLLPGEYFFLDENGDELR